jgi:hypothetical protein
MLIYPADAAMLQLGAALAARFAQAEIVCLPMPAEGAELEHQLRFYQRMAGLPANACALFAHGAAAAMALQLAPRALVGRIIAIAPAPVALTQAMPRTLSVHLIATASSDPEIGPEVGPEIADITESLRRLDTDFSVDIIPCDAATASPAMIAVAIERLSSYVPRHYFDQL